MMCLMDDLVVVKHFPTKIEAEIAQSYLKSNGIDALVRADDEGGMAGGFQFGAKGILLLVPSSDKERAQQLLKSK